MNNLNNKAIEFIKNNFEVNINLMINYRVYDNMNNEDFINLFNYLSKGQISKTNAKLPYIFGELNQYTFIDKRYIFDIINATKSINYEYVNIVIKGGLVPVDFDFYNQFNKKILSVRVAPYDIDKSIYKEQFIIATYETKDLISNDKDYLLNYKPNNTNLKIEHKDHKINIKISKKNFLKLKQILKNIKNQIIGLCSYGGWLIIKDIDTNKFIGIKQY